MVELARWYNWEYATLLKGGGIGSSPFRALCIKIKNGGIDYDTRLDDSLCGSNGR